MGNWKLEVFKMGVYISLPVGLFWYFNSASCYEEAIRLGREEMLRRTNIVEAERIRKMEEHFRQKKLEMATQKLKES